MRNVFRTLSWFEKNFEEIFVFLTLVAMATLIFGQTVSRFTINKTPSWTQELAQFIQVYFVYLGASLAIKKKAHIRITALSLVLPKGLHKSFEMVGYIFFLLFCAILSVWGLNLCNEIKNFNQLSASLQLPMFIPYLAVPLGGIIMGYRIVQQMVKLLTARANA